MTLRSRVFICIVLGLALLGPSRSFGQTIAVNPLAKQDVLDQVGQVLNTDAFVPGLDFSKWADLIKQEQQRIDDAKTDEEFQRVVNSVLRKFGATHMVLTAPKTADMRRDGATVGVGISTQRTAEGLLVTRTVPDAPAERGGIVPGDLVIAVDGKPATSALLIGGREGSDVTLSVRHVDKSTDDYILTRRKFSTLRQEEFAWIDKDTAKLTIYTFDPTYSHERVEGFMKDGMAAKNLILDLRDDGGGSIANFRKLLGLLVPANVAVGTFIDKKMVDDYIEATHGKPTDLAAIAAWSPRKLRPIPSETLPVFKGRVIVLINGASGSASEIIAAGLRDTIGATVIGTKSAGAVLVSRYVPASNGFWLQYATSDYVTIKGVRLEGTGVTPDIIVTDPKLKISGAQDDAVKKALEVFSSSKFSPGHVEG